MKFCKICLTLAMLNAGVMAKSLTNSNGGADVPNEANCDMCEVGASINDDMSELYKMAQELVKSREQTHLAAVNLIKDIDNLIDDTEITKVYDKYADATIELKESIEHMRKKASELTIDYAPLTEDKTLVMTIDTTGDIHWSTGGDNTLASAEINN